VLNLLENARDAIRSRPGTAPGRIAVATRLDPGGRTLSLVIDDNGPGLSDEVKDKLFTPYFTTKHAAGGTGLGLAIAHRIVSEHGGSIALGDAPGGGARVTVTLPVSGAR
jgi:signal transduction histidine kinase